MKKYLIVSVALVILAAIIFSGCSTTSTSVSTTTATSIATTTKIVKTMSLKFTYLMSNTNSTGKNMDAWAAAVTEQTQGRVKVTTYPSNTLVSSGDVYTAVQKGVADIAFGSVGDFPDLWPLGQVFSQPMVKVPMEA
jgi:TRAP-type C4-dicarboxylate transport system substrate-binding protein